MNVHLFVFQKHSIFIPLRSFYPEAMELVGEDPHPLACFTHPTPTNAARIEPIVRRAAYIFENLAPKLYPDVRREKVLYVYYKWQNRPNSIQAGVIWSDLRDPSVMILNPYAFRNIQEKSTAFEWTQPLDFTMLGHSTSLT